MEETGNRATATGKIWKLVYKAHAAKLEQHARCAAPAPAPKEYTIVQTERDDYANTIQTIHVII